MTHLDLRVHGTLLVVKLLVVVGVHLQVVERKLLLDPLLESLALLESQRVGLCDDGHDVDHVGQLLEDDDVDGLERVARRLDEEEATVDAGVLDVALPLRRELLAQVGRVLVLDVLHDRVPAALVVHQVAVTRRVHDVEPEPHAVLLDVVGYRVDLGRGADGLIGLQAAFRVDQVRREDGVGQRRLAETGLACTGMELAPCCPGSGSGTQQSP